MATRTKCLYQFKQFSKRSLGNTIGPSGECSASKCVGPLASNGSRRRFGSATGLSYLPLSDKGVRGTGSSRTASICHSEKVSTSLRSSARTNIDIHTSKNILQTRNLHSFVRTIPNELGRRRLHTSLPSHHGIKRPAPGTGIKVHWHDSHGTFLKTTEGNDGDSLLDLAQEYDIDMEGACEGSVACSTCHVILDPESYDKTVDEGLGWVEIEDDENDMLDMAFGLTETSRLGCQVKLRKELDGIKVTLPSATRNFFVDGAKPTKH